MTNRKKTRKGRGFKLVETSRPFTKLMAGNVEECNFAWLSVVVKREPLFSYQNRVGDKFIIDLLLYPVLLPIKNNIWSIKVEVKG